MQPIIICFFLLTVAQAAATITYSSIFTATLATSSVTLANAQTKEGIKTGFCTGGRASCAIFSGGEYCPSPYCPTGRGNTCGPAENYVGGGGFIETSYVACALLTEDECKAASNEYVTDCKYVNQGAIDSVLITFTTISVVMLLLILIILHRRLPAKTTALTQPLLDEENA